MQIISVRENPNFRAMATAYIQKQWASENTMKIYEDCISHMNTEGSSLPQWYLLMDNDNIMGCAGLITNDFISRMDLYPWVCAIFIEENQRGHNYGKRLIEKAESDAKQSGFNHIYLCTDHVGYYEKMGYSYIGDGYHPWGDESRIYKSKRL